MSKLLEQLEAIYIESGKEGVLDFVQENHPGLPWGYCNSCADNMPSVESLCVVCQDIIYHNEEE